MKLANLRALGRSISVAPALAFGLAASAAGQDLIVTAGNALVINTDTTPQLRLRKFEIQAGATVNIVGNNPFSVAAAEIVIDGTLDASGFSNPGVATLNTTNQPEPGASGQAGGGSGGTGSMLTNQSTPAGQNGRGSYGIGDAGGGRGGESCFNAPSFGVGGRRAAGGGGGALAANPIFPIGPFVTGEIAQAGQGGAPLGTGAISGNAPAAGGAAGTPIFTDNDPTNDFWGMRLTPSGLVFGEVGRPSAGRGGGAGGDAVRSATFPLNPFTATGDEKGSGGGGGGGLVLLHARKMSIGAAGRLRVDGGAGGGGENTIFFDRIGGGSGGGSGGWIVIEALELDLSEAGKDAITALGGRGGPGRNDTFGAEGAGGNGGPGVIQLHTPSGTAAEIALPPSATVEAMTAPDGIVLLPVLGG